MRYKAIVAYDGSNYNGWQKQNEVKSVQEEIERVLSKICNEEISIVASGRTDAGVHAYGQVFHFDCNLDMTSTKWIHAVNGYLPKDIRMQSVTHVSDDFHARFSAVGKKYEYLISTDVRNPFIQNYETLIFQDVDLEVMKECAQLFIGEHDFTSFCSSRIHPEKSRVKKIDTLDIVKRPNGYHFTYIGTGFLRYMIRMITQTLLEAGRGRITYEEIKDMLIHPDKDKCRYKANPNGLYLSKVIYEEDKNEED